MTPQRARWLDAGNLATGFIAFGNVVTGFIAIGNVARGFIAIGNVAVGVFAFGNVAVGLVTGFGATIALGALAGAGVLAFPVLGGVAGVANALDVSGALSLFPIVVWLLAARLFPGRRAPRPELPELTSLAALERGDRHDGWVLARITDRGAGALRLAQGGAAVEVTATPEALAALAALGGPRWRLRALAFVRAEERPRAEGGGGYREAQPRERVLACAHLKPVPKAPLPWVSAGEVQGWLARAWTVGAAAALALRAVQLLMSL